MTGTAGRGVGAVLAVVLLAGVSMTSPAEGQQATSEGALMLVLDASGSMAADAGDGQARIEAARAALTSLVDEFPDDVQVGLTVYGHRVGSDESLKEQGCQDIETITPVGPLDRTQLAEDVTSFEPSGYTPIGASLQQAADQLADSDGRRTIVLVSDGIDTCAPPEPCEVAQGLAAEGIDLTVETIGFQVEPDARQQLQCIAEATGGSYRDAPDAGSLSDSLQALSLRAYRDYQPTGDPISGGASRDEAVELPEGAHLDRLRPDSELWYSFEVPEGKDFGISATLVGDRERPTDNSEFEIRIWPADSGTWCDYRYLSGHLGGVATAVGIEAGPGVEPGQGYRCQGHRQFVARVHLLDYAPPGEFPLELRLDYLEPGRAYTAPDTTPSGPGDEVTGGASFTTAPLVEPGTYADNIRMGERQFWAIEVARGQTLTVTYAGQPLDVEGRAVARTVAYAGTRRSGDAGEATSGADGDVVLADGFEQTFSTETIDEQASERVYRRPGLYYITTELRDGPETALVDYELTLALEGDPVPDPTPSSATTDPTDPPSTSAPDDPVTTPAPATPDSTEAAAPDDDAASTSPWLWALVVLLVVAGLAGGGWAMYRTRGNAGMTGDGTRQDGSIAPAMMLVMFALAAAGSWFLGQAGAASLAAEGDSAADAAALAGADVMRTHPGSGVGAVASLLATGKLPPGLEAAAVAAAEDYAARNGGDLISADLRKVPGESAIEFEAVVRTQRTLEDQAPTRTSIAELRFSLTAPGAGACMSQAEVDGLLVAAGVESTHNGRSGLVECNNTDTQNLDPETKLAFLRAEAQLKQFESYDDAVIELSSAYRSATEQAALYAAYQACLATGASDCTPAAPPGASNHNYGRAIDVPSGHWQRLRDALAAPSWSPPPCGAQPNLVWPDIANDPYHFDDCRGRPPGLPNGNAFGLLEFDEVLLTE